MRIAINNCYGGFGLSHKAIKRYAELRGFQLISVKSPMDKSKTPKILTDEEAQKAFMVHYYKGSFDSKNGDNNYFSDRGILRTDAVLLEVIDELGTAANGRCAKIKIIEIPDDVDWEINEYDGIEHVAEKHRAWY